VRYTSELAFQDIITRTLTENEYFGDEVKQKLVYFPTVTREELTTNGRLTDLMTSGKLFVDVGLDAPHSDHDRFMLCGSPSMLKDTCRILDGWGMEESRHGQKAHYVIERAFVE